MAKNWRELISQPEYGIKKEKDVYVAMRDGARLAIDVYRPDAPGRFPALLAMSAYGKDEVALPCRLSSGNGSCRRRCATTTACSCPNTTSTGRRSARRNKC